MSARLSHTEISYKIVKIFVFGRFSLHGPKDHKNVIFHLGAARQFTLSHKHFGNHCVSSLYLLSSCHKGEEFVVTASRVSKNGLYARNSKVSYKRSNTFYAILSWYLLLFQN